MSSDLSIGKIQPIPDLSANQAAAAQTRGPARQAPSILPSSQQTVTDQGVRATSASADPQQMLDQATRHAAQDLYKGRDVQVTSMQDDATGRYIYRVTDRHSGEVLVQSPSEDLLRFYASGRAEQEGNLIALEA